MKSAARTTAATETLDAERPVGRASQPLRAAKKARPEAEAQHNPLTHVIGYRLRRAQLITFQEFIDYFSRLKLRPAEFALISVLKSCPGISQTKTASMLGIKRANFVSLLDSLERRGLAERRAVHGDRRFKAIHLTQAGNALAAKAALISERYETMLVERLGGPKERDLFMHMLDRLTGTAPGRES